MMAAAAMRFRSFSFTAVATVTGLRASKQLGDLAREQPVMPSDLGLCYNIQDLSIRTQRKGCSKMPEHLKRLIELARRVIMSDADREEQRRSFAYGNIKIENDMVTREIVDEEAEKLTAGHAR